MTPHRRQNARIPRNSAGSTADGGWSADERQHDRIKGEVAV